MAININVKDTFIPVQIGDIELKFDVSDNAVEEMFRKFKEVDKTIEEIDKANLKDEEAFKENRRLLQEAYDSLFGEGSYDKVYKLSPSLLITREYLSQIMEGIFKELEERGHLDDKKQVAKYLKK